MIVVATEFAAQAKHRLQVLIAANALVPASRAEPGCLSYCFYEQCPGSNEFLLLAQWADEAAFEAHNATAHLQEFIACIRRYGQSRRTIRIFEVSKYCELSFQMIPCAACCSSLASVDAEPDGGNRRRAS